ncbi:MAG: hypothetical protein ACI35P_07645 [Bacillus sp. (in: firmicutes)]
MAHAYSVIEVMSMSKSSSPLKLGTETYGVLKVEEVFVKALEYYFRSHEKYK